MTRRMTPEGPARAMADLDAASVIELIDSCQMDSLSIVAVVRTRPDVLDELSARARARAETWRAPSILDEVLRERQAQVKAGRTPELDRERHRHGELLVANWGAISRCRDSLACRYSHPDRARRRLIQAAALIVAEIERLDSIPAESAPTGAADGV